MTEFSNMAPTCDLTCENVGKPCLNRTVRNPGCYCKQGYIKDCNGRCVRSGDYCRMCNANEFYSDCAPIKEPTCQNPNQQISGAAPGCTCIRGHLRDYSGNCVLLNQCPSELK